MITPESLCLEFNIKSSNWETISSLFSYSAKRSYRSLRGHDTVKLWFWLSFIKVLKTNSEEFLFCHSSSSTDSKLIIETLISLAPSEMGKKNQTHKDKARKRNLQEDKEIEQLEKAIKERIEQLGVS